MRYGAGVYYKTDAIFTRLGFLRAEEQDDLGAGETETAGYTLLNADARYNLDLPDSALQLNLALEGRNLLDDDVRNHTSFKKNDVLQPGRDVRLVATLRF
jgi:iron complex outermembrane receptor protein